MRIDVAPVTRHVVWMRTQREDSFWAGKTLRQWEDFYTPILKVRGPKW